MQEININRILERKHELSPILQNSHTQSIYGWKLNDHQSPIVIYNTPLRGIKCYISNEFTRKSQSNITANAFSPHCYHNSPINKSIRNSRKQQIFIRKQSILRVNRHRCSFDGFKTDKLRHFFEQYESNKIRKININHNEEDKHKIDVRVSLPPLAYNFKRTVLLNASARIDACTST